MFTLEKIIELITIKLVVQQQLAPLIHKDTNEEFLFFLLITTKDKLNICLI